ncbi:MAG: hypothetical protein E5V74_06435 [Mesorhizobium sp.]|nr:MAG: hypothetical protein E5V74_06435 [Mesorhizobium sp.]
MASFSCQDRRGLKDVAVTPIDVALDLHGQREEGNRGRRDDRVDRQLTAGENLHGVNAGVNGLDAKFHRAAFGADLVDID